MLNFYSGSSGAVNTRRAIADCLEIALENELSLDCDLLIIYSSIGHNFRDLLDEALRLAPSAQVVGCTGAGVIGREGPIEAMKALAIMAIKGPRSEFTVAYRERITSATSFQVSGELARELFDKNPNITMIHFLPSGFDVAEDLALEGIESVFGTKIPIFGATAGDNMRLLTNFQFIGDKIVERGAVAIGFADPTLDIITRATHGWTTMGEPCVVTRSDLNRVYEIDDDRAWQFACDKAGIPDTASLLEASSAIWFAQELPKSLQSEYGSAHILRSAFHKYEDDSLQFPVVLPEGTKLWHVARDEEGMFSELDRIVAELVKSCLGRKIEAVFHADCVGRGRWSLNKVLKDEIIRRMQYPLIKEQSVPWLGLYGFGEFAQICGRNHFHMVTTSLFLLLRNGT